MLEKGEMEMTCKSCNAVNIVSYTDYPERDRGSLACAGCGAILIEWKGTRDFHAARLKPNDP